jgi:GTPase SAR1 family protein
MYVEGAALAVIAFDVSSPRSWDTVEHWVAFLSEHAHCPFVLIGTKADLGVDDAAAEAAGAWAMQRGVPFFTTSAKTRENIAFSLKGVQEAAAAQRTILPLPGVVEPVPANQQCC